MTVSEAPRDEVPRDDVLLLDRPTATIVLDRYEAIREALFNKDLSRSFDKRTYDDGNVRDGVVSIVHGATHRARRRVENAEFRADRLRLYERDLFPGVLDEMLDRLIDDRHVDLFELGELLSVVLAARRAGLDHDGSVEQLGALVRYVDAFSQASAILDAKDPDTVRAAARRAWVDFEHEFVRPSWASRLERIEAFRRGELLEVDLPHDILTVLLLHRGDPLVELGDDGRIVREVGTYLQGGTHTSSQTLINTLDLLFPRLASEPGLGERIVGDKLLAQRCIHETLRLRPTTPKIKRRAEADLTVAGHAIPKDALVVLDVATANRDPRLFGTDAEEFNPDRRLGEDVARWGLSFGGGPHQCPGRSVAGGFPVPPDFAPGEEHLFGLVALMVQAVLRRGVRPDPGHEPVRDTRTERYTRWSEYPVLFDSPRRVTRPD
jgi:cytochrome P450